MISLLRDRLRRARFPLKGYRYTVGVSLEDKEALGNISCESLPRRVKLST